MAYGDTTAGTTPLAAAGTTRSIGLDKPPTKKKPKRPGIIESTQLAEAASRLGEMATARRENQPHMGVRQPLPNENKRKVTNGTRQTTY